MTEEINYTYSSNNYYEYLPGIQDEINSKIEHCRQNRYVEKIYDFNYFLWSDNPSEITNRLGWLYIHYVMMDAVKQIESFSMEIREKGFKHVLLLGMGGSSLSCDVFRNIFGSREGYPDINIVDTTDPEYLNGITNRIDLKKTLIIVSTKSGSTVETISAMKFFYSRLGNSAGEHFVGITDPGSGLVDIAKDYNFLKVFINDPNIGGRFSVLSYFGLVPASLTGVDIKRILAGACSECDITKNTAVEYENKTSLRLGLVMGLLEGLGKDKLTFLFSEELYSFGYWAEQLIAESTGKNGKGILPVLDQKNLTQRYLKEDRVFIFFVNKIDNSTDDNFIKLAKTGYPLIKIVVDDEYQLGREFFRFEFATAVAGAVMQINPFDQPDVESAKVMAKKALRETEKNKTNTEKYDFKIVGLNFVSNCGISSLGDFKELVNNPEAEYISIQAYVNSCTDNVTALHDLRDTVEEMSALPVTLGLGPRFLHSTGQLHKGDAGRGVFIQLVSQNKHDAVIPESPGSAEGKTTFSQLKLSQAAGDYKALDIKGRRVVSVFMPSDDHINIAKFNDLLL